MYVFLGGSFDPVHFGHLRIATELSDVLNEPVHLMPCKSPVHKLDTSADSLARSKMLELAIRDDPKLRLDLRELNADSDSYTVRSLREMREQGLGPIVMAVGTDSAISLSSWKNAKEFAALCHLVVLKRPGNDLVGDNRDLLSGLSDLGFEETIAVEELSQAGSGKVLLQPVTQLEISSSDIRYRVEQKMSIRYLVPDAVERFICDNAIYGP